MLAAGYADARPGRIAVRAFAALQAARDDSATVADQARRLYRSGRTGYLDSLDAERALASSEAALAATDAELADDQVALFLALGGGWEGGKDGDKPGAPAPAPAH